MKFKNIYKTRVRKTMQGRGDKKEIYKKYENSRSKIRKQRTRIERKDGKKYMDQEE